MLRVNSVATSCSLLLLLCIANGYRSQQAKSGLREPSNRQVSDYEDSGHDFPTTIDHLMREYKISWGIDSEAPLKNTLTSVHISRGTVADALNAIIAQEPDYRWVEVNGVINVIPKEDANSLMNVRIARFHIVHADVYGIHTALVSLPEAKRWLAMNHLTERTPVNVIMAIGKNGTGLPHVSLDMHDITLGEILNRIIKSPGFSSWEIGRWGEKNQYVSIGVS